MGTESPYRYLSSVLLISYIIVVSILLFNLLIAMMGNTYSDINEEAKKHWQLQKCRTIFSIQSEMSREELRSLNYFVEIDKKRFLEVTETDVNHFKKKDLIVDTVSK